MPDLQSLADKIEIQELLARYARGVDTSDWELWKSVFTPDAQLDYTDVGFPVGTPEEIAAAFAPGFEHIPWAQHVITNVEIDLDGDTATVRAMFLNPMQLPGMAEMSMCGGHYLHEMVRTPAGWKSRHLIEKNVWFHNRPGGEPAG